MASTDFLWMAMIFTLVALVGTSILTIVLARWLMSDIRELHDRIDEVEKSSFLRKQATEKFLSAIERRSEK